MPRLAAAFVIALVAATAVASSFANSEETSADIAAARALFEKNLDAIKRRDRDAYLACYLDADSLARTGFEGFRLGYKPLAEETGTAWPDRFEGLDLQLVSVKPGVVYGTYRYRVAYGAVEQSGISERFFLKTAAGWRIAVSTAFQSPPGTPPPPRALVGATLLDGTGAPAVPDSVVILRGGMIDCAGTRAQCPVPAGIDTLDLAGKFLTPGLVDSHVHFSQTGWADGRPDSLDLREKHPYEKVASGLRADPGRFFRSYICSGVTAVFDVGGYPWTFSLPARAEADTLAPHVAAAGPLLSTRDHWLNLPAERQFIFLADEKAAREGARYLAAQGAAAVKVWFIVSGERPFEEMEKAVAAAGDEAKSAGLPLIVHATGLKEAKSAMRAGARLLVHSVWDLPVDDEFISLAKEKGTIYCPTMIVRDGYNVMFRSVRSGQPPPIDDPRGCVDTGTLERVASTALAGAERVDPNDFERRAARAAEQSRIGAANLKRIHEAGIPIAMGTDAGNPLTLHGASVFAEMEAMESAGMKPLEVLAASTRNGALAMGRLADFGTVEKGKIADLLIVGADPSASVSNLRRIEYVVRGGVVRSAGELRPR